MIVFVACTKKKLNKENIPAEELYSASCLFRKTLAYAKTLGEVHIMSSKYGILSLEDNVSAYEKTLNKMKKADREQFKLKIKQQLEDRNIHGKVISLMGKNYDDIISCYLQVENPFKGLPIGKRLQRLNQLNS